MALEIQEEPGTKIIVVDVTGKLVKEDYDQFVPKIEALIQRVGQLRILFIMTDFHGWDLGAVWEDIKFDIRHFRDIERLAIVGETKWEQWMASFCKPFTMAQIKYFDVSQRDMARQWLNGANDKNATDTE